MNDEQRKAMFAKQGSKGHGLSSGIRAKSDDFQPVIKKEISAEGRELQRDLLEALKNTPRDKRKLTVITYNKNHEREDTTILSLDGISSFEHSRQDLAKLIKNLKVGKTIGWSNGKVRVFVEKYYDVPKDYFIQHPEEKEAFYKYGNMDKKQLITKFYVEKLDGTESKSSRIYGKIINDPDWNVQMG